MITIIGEKIVLTEGTQTDIDDLYYWIYLEKEQEAKKWNGPYIPEPHKSLEEFRKQWKVGNVISGLPDTLVIKAEDKLIGTVSCYWVDQNTNWLETGIVIYDKDFWNGGYGTEAYRMWITFLFESTDIQRLGMSTWSGNIRMMKAAAKVGMREEARIRNARIVNGEYFDAIKMRILRSEWEAIRKGDRAGWQ